MRDQEMLTGGIPSYDDPLYMDQEVIEVEENKSTDVKNCILLALIVKLYSSK